MVVVTVVLFFYNVELALDHAAADRARCSPACRCGSGRASDQGYARVRDGIAGVLSDLAESLSGVRVVAGVQPPAPQRRSTTATSSARTATPTTTPPTSAPSTAPAPSSSACSARRSLLLIGGNMVLRRRRSRIGELTAFILYLNAFFLPIQQLVQLYNLYQQGQAAIAKLRELLATAPDGRARRPTPSTLPPIDGRDRARAT